MPRRSLIATAVLSLLLGACSRSVPPPVAGTTTPGSGSPTATEEPTPDGSGTPRARPEDRRPTGRPAPTPPPPGRAPAHTPPAAGRYSYTQTGSFELGAIKTEPDPVGTLTVERPRIEGGGQAQRHIRTVSERNEITSVYQFAATGVRLTYISQQGVECAPEPALMAVELPLKVNNEWKSHGVCGDVQIDVLGKVMAAETLTIAGMKVETFRVHLATEIRSPNFTLTTGTKAWVSPAYRLVVRSEEASQGTFAGAPYSSSLNATIRSLTPA